MNFLPISTSKANADQKKLQTEYLSVRKELNATSSQDQFAKWAKLRRQHDKLLEQLEVTSKSNCYKLLPPIKSDSKLLLTFLFSRKGYGVIED